METLETLQVKLVSVDDKLRLSGTARGNPDVFLDHAKPLGTGQGYSPLELLMLSFGSCLSSVLLSLLRGNRMNKTVDALAAEVRGVTRDRHPKALESMTVTFRIKAKDLTEEEVRQLLGVAEEKLCPVWAMIKGNVRVETVVEIKEEAE